MLKDYFFLALSNLKHRRLRSLLTVLGIVIGIAAVVSLISLGNGLKEAVTGQFATLDANKLIVQSASTSFGPPGSNAVRKLNKHDLNIISQVNYISGVVIRYIRVVKVEYNKEAHFDYITSVPEDSTQVKLLQDTFNLKLEDGRFLTSTDKEKVVLGKDLTNSYDKQIRVGTHLTIQGKDFEVVGVLKKGSSFQINQVVFMPEADLKEILNIGDEIDAMVVQVSYENKVSEVALEIERKLRQDRHEKIGEEDFSVQTPLQAVEAVNTVLNIVNIIIAGIAAISLIIGGIGIANTMYTSALERKKEIGIMKAVGARRKDILFVFIVEAGLLGLIGGVMGAILGLGLAFGLSALAGLYLGGFELKVMVSWPLLFASVGFSFFIGLLSGVIPAFQASKLNVVDAIRN